MKGLGRTLNIIHLLTIGVLIPIVSIVFLFKGDGLPFIIGLIVIFLHFRWTIWRHIKQIGTKSLRS